MHVNNCYYCNIVNLIIYIPTWLITLLVLLIGFECFDDIYPLEILVNIHWFESKKYHNGC